MTIFSRQAMIVYRDDNWRIKPSKEMKPLASEAMDAKGIRAR
jgi:hypothetical protein